MRRALQAPVRLACLPLAKLALSGPNGDIVRQDADAWLEMRKLPCEPGEDTITFAMASLPELRGILYYRMSMGDGTLRKLVAFLYRAVLPPYKPFVVHTREIGPGFTISGGDGLYLAAEKIGPRCMILQQVTLGRLGGADTGPTIGAGVYIGAGAKILGPIRVGDNAKIGANAVVLKDVPDGATAVGVPARNIVKDGSAPEQPPVQASTEPQVRDSAD